MINSFFSLIKKLSLILRKTKTGQSKYINNMGKPTHKDKHNGKKKAGGGGFSACEMSFKFREAVLKLFA